VYSAAQWVERMRTISPHAEIVGLEASPFSIRR
jgi:hypothetical protein